MSCVEVSSCIKYANASFYDADIKQGSKRIGAKKGVKMLNSCIKLGISYLLFALHYKL